MKTIVAASQKGGSGKTTLARNVAAALAVDAKVILIDLDPQRGLSQWYERRPDDGVSEITILPDTDYQTILQRWDVLDDNFDYAIIDTPPSTTDWLPLIVEKSDLVCIPVKLTADDYLSAKNTVEAANDTPYLIVPSMADTRSSIAKATLNQLEKLGPVTPRIGQRAIYSEAAFNGLGVTELKNKAAAQEMAELTAAIKSKLSATEA